MQVAAAAATVVVGCWFSRKKNHLRGIDGAWTFVVILFVVRVSEQAWVFGRRYTCIFSCVFVHRTSYVCVSACACPCLCVFVLLLYEPVLFFAAVRRLSHAPAVFSFILSPPFSSFLSSSGRRFPVSRNFSICCRPQLPPPYCCSFRFVRSSAHRSHHTRSWPLFI